MDGSPDIVGSDRATHDDVFSKTNYRRMRELLRARVGERRFEHSVGVAKCAKHLAKVYGCDPKQARMAGILHDWDKGLDRDDIRARVTELNVDAPREIVEDMPWLLHGPTAAAALRRDYPELGEEVFSAISKHTTGSTDMSPLDCIIYVADIIEPNRSFGDEAAIARLREKVGKVPLDELYFHAFKYTVMFLVSRDRRLAPDTLRIWNDLMSRFGHAAGFV